MQTRSLLPDICIHCLTKEKSEFLLLFKTITSENKLRFICLVVFFGINKLNSLNGIALYYLTNYWHAGIIWKWQCSFGCLGRTLTILGYKFHKLTSVSYCRGHVHSFVSLVSTVSHVTSTSRDTWSRADFDIPWPEPLKNIALDGRVWGRIFHVNCEMLKTEKSTPSIANI